jgi:Zn-finger nucleic acid-binding protein
MRNMNCPNCKEVLVMAERLGIEIDYCPNCRGVWLDRGELDKIIERSFQSECKSNFNPHNRMNDFNDYNHHGYSDHKKKGWLGELFD